MGDHAYLQEAVQAFMQASENYDYQLVFMRSMRALRCYYMNTALTFIKTGEEGLVKLSEFTPKVKRRAQRALMNKFEREGYEFSFVEPPFTDELIAELQAVSDSWLGKQVEKGFSLGFFDEDYLNEAPVCS